MNIGFGIGLVVVLCSAIAIGFMIAIERCFGNSKSDRNEAKGTGPNIGDVEIIEADGYYAVRQFAWYDYDYDGTDWLDRISYFKTYWKSLGGLGGCESSSSKWLYVGQNSLVGVDPEPVTLEFARSMAEELRARFSDHCSRCEYFDKMDKERQRVADALRNGKVIG